MKSVLRWCATAALLLFSALPSRVLAQGCVAARYNPTSPLLEGCANCTLMANEWLASVSYRWLHSDSDFRGDQEQHRVEAEDPVSNEIHSIDLSVAYGITDRWSATFSLPFVSGDRTTKYEHDGIHQHTMHAGGLADVRLVTDFWLLNPHEFMDGNIALGIGLKAPTGDDKASDVAHRDTGPVVRPVDLAIQPGDGGWGVILEVQAYQKIYRGLSGYVSGSYLMTPQEQNGVEVPYADQFEVPSALKHNSIADQYLGRAGVNYSVWPEQGLALSLGVRDEGIPVHDAIGGSLGFRRPGYVVSLEPGSTWSHERNAISITAPVAVYRNRERSAAEEAAGYPGGDGTFADFLVMASFIHRF
ncbi:MAG: hypothetical protein HY270_14050 [Deltaproteobacteria bacterium]|nr:hypothetical protein [Deltaproteobacteria bacterium]